MRPLGQHRQQLVAVDQTIRVAIKMLQHVRDVRLVDNAALRRDSLQELKQLAAVELAAVVVVEATEHAVDVVLILAVVAIPQHSLPCIVPQDVAILISFEPDRVRLDGGGPLDQIVQIRLRRRPARVQPREQFPELVALQLPVLVCVKLLKPALDLSLRARAALRLALPQLLDLLGLRRRPHHRGQRHRALGALRHRARPRGELQRQQGIWADATLQNLASGAGTIYQFLYSRFSFLSQSRYHTPDAAYRR